MSSKIYFCTSCSMWTFNCWKCVRVIRSWAYSRCRNGLEYLRELRLAYLCHWFKKKKKKGRGAGGITLLNFFTEHPRVAHQSGRACLVLQPLATSLLPFFFFFFNLLIFFPADPTLPRPDVIETISRRQSSCAAD